MKIKFTTYLFIVLLVFSSCKTNKNVATNNSTDGYTSGNKIKGERIYFGALKEKVKENYTEALKLFEQAVKTYPKIDAAFYEISLIKYSQKDYASALKNIESALKIESTNKWYRELHAELLAVSMKFDKSAQVYKKLKAEYPHNSDYYYSEAYFLMKQNKTKEALKVYNLLESKIGVQEDLTNEKYLLYIKESNFKEAENELLKLSSAYPRNLKYLNKIAKFHLSNNKPDKAIDIFKQILIIEPNNTKALMALAGYYQEIGEVEASEKYSEKVFLNKYISIDTKIGILYNYIKASDKEPTELKKAYKLVKLLAKTHPEDAKVWAIYGDIYNVDKKDTDALIKYKKSLEIRKDVFSVWQQVFFIQSDQDMYDELIEYTENAKELFPNQSMVYYFNGVGYQQKKQYQKSNKAYERAVKITVKNPTLKAQIYSNLGENYNDLKAFENSDKFFEKSLEINPNNQYVLNNYAYYLSLRNEKLNKAKEMSKKSLDLSKDNPTYLDTYAWIFFKNKEFKEALKYQEKAVALSTQASAGLYEHLGDILFELNRVDEAVKKWQKAQSLDKNNKVLDFKIKNKKLK